MGTTEWRVRGLQGCRIEGWILCCFEWSLIVAGRQVKVPSDACCFGGRRCAIA